PGAPPPGGAGPGEPPRPPPTGWAPSRAPRSRPEGASPRPPPASASARPGAPEPLAGPPEEPAQEDPVGHQGAAAPAHQRQGQARQGRQAQPARGGQEGLQAPQNGDQTRQQAGRPLGHLGHPQPLGNDGPLQVQNAPNG